MIVERQPRTIQQENTLHPTDNRQVSRGLRQPSFMPVASGLLQRNCACGGTAGLDGECAACRAKRLGVQRLPLSSKERGSEGEVAPPIVREALQSPSQPLDAATRAFLEPRFGYDFSEVRIHADAKAAESAQAVNALAYTVGSDVVFGSGKYAPETLGGEMLLAHELSHVVQTGGKADRIYRWFTRNRLPFDYEFAGRPRTVRAGLAHEDITENVLNKPDFTAQFDFGPGAKERVVTRSAYLDVYKEVLRREKLEGRMTEAEFRSWERYNHGFTRPAGEHQRDNYINWAITLANEENDNLREALDKVGDALHVAEDMNAHLFIPPGCSPWPDDARGASCSEAQDDPGINPDGFGHAFVDTWDVLQRFYRGLTPEKQRALSTF